MRFVVAALAILFASTALAASPPNTCGDGIPCEIETRSYQAKTPPGWNGASSLPVLIHFHGWGRTGINVIRNKRISGATDANEMLLLAPDGLGKSWSFWSNNRADIEFTEAMLTDAETRWPIDRTRVYVSGFSYGSAMAWALACDQGDRYAGFLGIAGILSSLPNKDCPTGPLTLRNVHGEKDTVMRPPWDSGATAWKQMLVLAGCSPDHTTVQNGKRTRKTWAQCADGHSVSLDTHPGGHWIPKSWLRDQLNELLAR